MEERMLEEVKLERLRRDATCVLIRLGLGGYTLQGPSQNIFAPESYVAWATVRSELGNEGYFLMTPTEYAEACGVEIEEVLAQVHEKGSLFALVYGEAVVVPLPEKEAVLAEIEV